jgi:hypothetical protein
MESPHPPGHTTYQTKQFQSRRQYELLPATGSFFYRSSEHGSFITWKARIRRDIPPTRLNAFNPEERMNC